MRRQALRVACFAVAFAGCGGGPNGTGSDGASSGDGAGGGDLASGCPPGGMMMTLATLQTQASCGPRLALDGDSVYFVAGAGVGGGAIRKAPKTGGATVDIATSPDKALCDLVVDGGAVYWTTGINDEVKRAPSGGGAEQTLVRAPVADTEYQNLAVDGAQLFFTVRSGAQYPIDQAPSGGGPPTALATQPELITGFVVLADALVGTDPGPAADPVKCAGQGICNYPSGRIVTVAKAGGPPVAIVSSARNLAVSATGIRQIAADATSLYWLSAAPVDGNVHRNFDGAVMKATLAGAPAAPLATGFNIPEAIALDDASVYFIADGKVWRVSKAGGAVVVVVDGNASGALAVDGEFVYWFDGKTVARACK